MSRPTWQTCKRWTCYVIGVKATRVEVLINCRNAIYLAAKALNCQQTSDNLVLFCRNVQIPQTHCRKTLQKKHESVRLFLDCFTGAISLLVLFTLGGLLSLVYIISRRIHLQNIPITYRVINNIYNSDFSRSF